MDPGTFVGIISLVIQATQILFDYYDACISQFTHVRDISKKLDSLLDTFQIIRVQLEGRQFQPSETVLLKQIESLIDECKECIQELRDEADKFKKYPVSSVQSVIQTTVRRVAYPFRTSTLEKLDEDIDDVITRLRLVLQLLQQEVVDRSAKDLEEVKDLLDIIRNSQVSADLTKWLNPPDATIDFNEAYKRRHPGTGLWLVQGEQFDRWMKYPASMLWLKGFGGCGKSVLCSTAIQHTLSYHRSKSIGVAFFFFKFDNKSKQDASALLRTIISQLSTQSFLKKRNRAFARKLSQFDAARPGTVGLSPASRPELYTCLPVHRCFG